MGNCWNCIDPLAIIIVVLAIAGSVSADENVREVQEKLHNDGFYSGEIDGAYSSDLTAALNRYQIRNGLPITGQLDVETSKALGAKSAIGSGTPVNGQSSEAWRRLRKGERRTPTSIRPSETAATDARETSSPTDNETAATGTQMQPASAPVAKAQTSAETTERAPAPTPKARTSPLEITEPSTPPSTTRTSAEIAKPASALSATVPGVVSSAGGDISTERLRDYVGAFVQAGLDPDVGSEADFFADRVKYYEQGLVDREKIRNDLQDYAGRWPERHFSFAGSITIEQEHQKRVRVTFPLQYELRNGARYSSGTIIKTLILEPAGNDLQIVAVNERKAQ